MINYALIPDLDEEILNEALSIFITSNKIIINQLNDLLDQEEYQSIRLNAHKLAGSSISVGLEDFSQLAKQIEEQIEEQIANNNHHVGDLLARLVNEFSSVEKYILSR